MLTGRHKRTETDLNGHKLFPTLRPTEAPSLLFHAGFVNGEDGGFFPFAFGDFDEGDVAADID